MGMAVFTDHFIAAFDLTRTQLSIAYLLGTLTSSVFLTRAGRFYDRTGARISVVGASVGLGVFVAFIACIDYLATIVNQMVTLPSVMLTFPLILIGYFGVRFTGQGVLTGASRNVLLVWYERRRGLATGTRGVVATLAYSLAPVFLAFLITKYGWRGALFSLALIVGVVFALLSMVFVRDTPESCGLIPDGGPIGDAPDEIPTYPNRTPAEAKRSPVFWIYATALAFYSVISTAIVFHIVSIFAQSGRSAEEAFGYFFPLAIVSVSTSLSASWLADYLPLKPLLVTMLAMFIVGAAGLLNLDTTSGYWVMVVGLGVTGGLWNVLSNLTFIRFFGRQYLGEISGMNAAMMVVGSAIGPALFSVCKDLFGSYDAAIWFSLGLLVIVLAVAVITPQSEPKPLEG